MTQLDDLQAYVNFELPRRSAFLTTAIAGYDGDPTLPAAPDILDLSPQGTWYREDTAGKWWRKLSGAAGDWEDNTPGGGGGGVTIYATETALLADTPSDGTIGYAEDTDRYFFRKAGAWVARGEFIATDTIDAAGTGSQSSRYGLNSVASGTGSGAFGRGASAVNFACLAFGNSASAGTGTTDQATAIGPSSLAQGLRSYAAGYQARVTATAREAFCIGALSVTGGERSVLIATSETTAGTYSVGVGYNAGFGNFTQCTLIGAFAAATGIGNRATSLGYRTESGYECAAVGYRAEANAGAMVSMGTFAGLNGGVYSTNLGHYAGNAGDDNTVSVGALAYARSSGATVVGRSGLASADYGIALGYETTVSSGHAYAVAVGRGTTTTAANRCTMGNATYPLSLQVQSGLGVFGTAPPATQPAKINDPTDLASCITAITAIIDVLEGAGLSSPT